MKKICKSDPGENGTSDTKVMGFNPRENTEKQRKNVTLKLHSIRKKRNAECTVLFVSVD